jgi:hypothetical protein
MSHVLGGGSCVASPTLIFAPVSGVVPPFTFKLDFSDARNSAYVVLFGGFF